VVVLQAPGAGGTAALAEVADRAGALTLLKVDSISDPGIAALRLVDPVAGPSDRTLLLPRPGAASVAQLIGNGVSNPVPPGGVVVLDGDQGGESVAVLDRDSRVLGDGSVPPSDRMPVTAGAVRLVAPLWDGRRVRLPQPNDYTAGQLLGATLDRARTAPVGVGLIEDIGAMDLPSGRQAEPRFYEVHRAGRTYLGWIVWIGDTPYCPHLDDVTDSGGQPDALVLRCPLPRDHAGILFVLLHNGIRLTRVQLDAARPGENPATIETGAPLEKGLVRELPHLPTGPGLVRLEDVSGQRRPDLELPRLTP
jgi:hypothetical protein